MRLLQTAGAPEFETDQVADDGDNLWFHPETLHGLEAFPSRAPRDLAHQGILDEWSRCACDLGAPNVMSLSRYQGNNDPSLIAVAGSNRCALSLRASVLSGWLYVTLFRANVLKHIYAARWRSESDKELLPHKRELEDPSSRLPKVGCLHACSSQRWHARPPGIRQVGLSSDEQTPALPFHMRRGSPAQIDQASSSVSPVPG